MKFKIGDKVRLGSMVREIDAIRKNGDIHLKDDWPILWSDPRVLKKVKVKEA